MWLVLEKQAALRVAGRWHGFVRLAKDCPFFEKILKLSPCKSEVS